MNLCRIEKAIGRAKGKIAERKLREFGAYTYTDPKTRKLKALYHIYSKSSEYTDEEKRKIKELEKFCDECIELKIMHFIDDLGDEFGEGTE